MLRPLRYLLACFLYLSLPAWAGGVVLALSDSSGPYAEFSNTLAGALADTQWKLAVIGPADTVNLGAGRAELIVTAGAGALRQVLARNPQLPVLATLLPRQSFERIVAEAGKPRVRIGAIWLDQPPARQAAFLRLLLPDQKRIGLLYSSETRSQFAPFRSSFAQAGLTLDGDEMEGDETLLSSLSGLLPRVGALLAIPDQTIYRRDNIKTVLVTAFRHHRPVIAFSAAFVNAGALAALYSTPTQIARQAADLILASGTALPAPMPPAQFAIAVNYSVAQAFGLSIPDEAGIRRALLAERESR